MHGTPLHLSHDLGNIENDTSLAAFVAAAAAKAHERQRLQLPLATPRTLTPAVTFTYSNFAYESGFANWLFCTAAALTTPIVGAMDRPTYDWFERRNVSVILLHDSQLAPLAQRSLYIKAELTQRLLGEGLKVIFSEMDIFWINDPQLLEDATLDLQASEQGFGKDDLNLGFYMAQPTRAARQLFRRLARWPYAPGYVHCWDQALFDYAVRGSFRILEEECKHAVKGATSREQLRLGLRDRHVEGDRVAGLREHGHADHAHRGDGRDRPKESQQPRPLRWARISYELLPHPFKWHGKLPQQLPRAAIALGGVIAVHLWTTVSPVPPPLRIACARTMGFWALPPSQDERRPGGGRLRVGPLLKESEKSLPNEAVYYREAVVELLGRLRERRAEQLATLGHDVATAPSFPLYVPMQRYGRGTWPNGTSFAIAGAPRLTSQLNFSALGGKCAAGLSTTWEVA